MKMHSIQSRFVIGPSNKLFDGVHVNTFNPDILLAQAVEGLRLYLKI